LILASLVADVIRQALEIFFACSSWGNFSAYWRRMEPMGAVPRGSAFTVGISSHHTGTWKSILYNECGVVADKKVDGNQHEYAELPILDSRRIASYPNDGYDV
jgi:hypothetical protein